MEDIKSRMGGDYDISPGGSPQKKPDDKDQLDYQGLTKSQKAYKAGYRKGKLRGTLETLISIALVTGVLLIFVS
jgi:hypothetical protein